MNGFLKYGIKADIINIISNTENDDTFKFSKDMANLEILDKFENQFVISYIGADRPPQGFKNSL